LFKTQQKCAGVPPRVHPSTEEVKMYFVLSLKNVVFCYWYDCKFFYERKVRFAKCYGYKITKPFKADNLIHARQKGAELLKLEKPQKEESNVRIQNRKTKPKMRFKAEQGLLLWANLPS